MAHFFADSDLGWLMFCGCGLCAVEEIVRKISLLFGICSNGMRRRLPHPVLSDDCVQDSVSGII